MQIFDLTSGFPIICGDSWYSRGPLIRLGINTPARAERVCNRNGERGSSNSTLPEGSGSGEIFDIILYFGIIDILQDYDIIKKLEHAYKSLQVDPTSISAVDPKLYSKRFKDFIHRIFVEDKWKIMLANIRDHYWSWSNAIFAIFWYTWAAEPGWTCQWALMLQMASIGGLRTEICANFNCRLFWWLSFSYGHC